jgi:hypothetical protein
MVRPRRPEGNRAAPSFGQLKRFHHVINSDKVFGTHRDAAPCATVAISCTIGTRNTPSRSGLLLCQVALNHWCYRRLVARWRSHSRACGNISGSRSRTRPSRGRGPGTLSGAMARSRSSRNQLTPPFFDPWLGYSMPTRFKNVSTVGSPQ